jgi:protein-disulfide isomerase
MADNKHRHLTKKERQALRREEKKQAKLNQQKQERRNRLFRRIALWLLVVSGVGGGVFGMIWLAKNPSPTRSPQQSYVDSSSGWTKGNKDAKVTLVEYSDFQCPACRNSYAWIKRLNLEFNDKMLFVYRHFPLKEIHSNAELAARAAEAAGRQGKFWEMHDLLFENQSDWANQSNAEDTFIKYAQRLNLSVEQFKNDLNSKEVREKVENDYQHSIQSGIDATPTFFLNGKKIQNPRSYEEFKNLIQQALQSNS